MNFFQIITPIWPLLLLAVVVLIGIGVFQVFFRKEGDEVPDLSVYERKPFLFDTVSEFNLYKILLELYGATYH